MCIGVPMRVVEVSQGWAFCEADGQCQEIDMALVGDQAVGTWVLTFLGAAREVLTAEQAEQISDALSALTLAMNGGSTDAIDSLFPDLANREPELPAFLREGAAQSAGATGDER